jgi:hypothetical protein
MSETLRARLDALIVALKGLPTLPSASGGGYVEYFVSQAEVWRIAEALAALLREPPAAAPLFTWTEFDVIKTAIRNSREIGTAQYFHVVKKLQTVSEPAARAAAPEAP